MEDLICSEIDMFGQADSITGEEAYCTKEYAQVKNLGVISRLLDLHSEGLADDGLVGLGGFVMRT